MKKILSVILILTMLVTGLLLVSCNDYQKPTNDQGYSIALDLTEEWNKISNGAQLVQGCIVVRKGFAESNPATVKKFLDEYKDSVLFTKANPKEASNYIKEFGIFDNAAIAEKAIPNCNIAYLEGDTMKSYMSDFLNAMYSVAPASIGNKIPSDDFYYFRSENENFETNNVRITTLNGTTGFGMAKLMHDASVNETENNYTFNVVSDATNIVAGLINGSIDIAALPTNAASNVYNKANGSVQILAINTLGVLYALDKTGEINSISDLEGKTIYCPTQNPSFILEYILKANNINATINSTDFSTPAALRTAVIAGRVDIAILPEPMVSIVMATANQ